MVVLNTTIVAAYDLESYAVEQVYNAKFTELAKDIVVHEDIVAKYKLSEIAMNAHSNF